MVNPGLLELLTPRILVVDDERQIHASLRLRLAKDYDLVCSSHPREALEAISANRFDLCFVDIHMPEMDGFTFIEHAQRLDAALGYLMLSAFDTAENLRRTIPLRVFDFIGKPLPERHDFEARIPEWIARTRAQRREQALLEQGVRLHEELDSARLERDVELVASETARDALLQTANLLTTIQAHVFNAASSSASRAKSDPSLAPLARSLEEARKATQAATSVSQSFFDSAYAMRDTSPALIDPGIRQAIGIASRMNCADAANKVVDLDLTALDSPLAVSGLSGLEFLLMIVPVVGAALARTEPNTTVGVQFRPLARLESVTKDTSLRDYLWANRRSAPANQSGLLLTLTAAAPALSRTEAEAWLKGGDNPLSEISLRGFIDGLQKCHGFLAVSLSPQSGKFQLLVGLPT